MSCSSFRVHVALTLAILFQNFRMGWHMQGYLSLEPSPKPPERPLQLLSPEPPLPPCAP